MRHRNHTDLKRLLIGVMYLCTALTATFGIGAPSVNAASPNDAEKRQRVEAMYADYRKDFPGIKEIDAEAAIELLSDPGVVFVDVRNPKEQAVSMIPGAITDTQFMDQLDQYRDKRVIAYCTISYRSGKLAAKLQKKGISVTNLKGGLLGWVHAGGPLVQDNQPVQTLHVYGRKWDLAPDSIKTVY
jgi:rhodanese-related sulfurtransferase